MSLPPVNATTIALNNSAPGTSELIVKFVGGLLAIGFVICVGAVGYSKVNPPNNSSKTTPAKGGSRHTRRALRSHRNGTRKAY